MKNKNCIGNKKIIYILLFICALQLLLALFWADKKSYLFMDELFSYAASNRIEGIETDLPANEWLDGGWLTEYMSADEEHRFEYSIPYRNQETDVHPPLFYLILHTACSLIPEEFSYWSGTGCNIVFFITSTIALYFLGKELFQDKVCGLLAALLYSISYGGLNTMVFIRMYMLLTLLVVLHTYVYLKYFEQDDTPVRGYVLLAVTVILGMLTQYYFVFIAFFFGVWYALKFFFKKQYKRLGRYMTAAAISAGCSIACYPTMIKHIFGTSRGAEARENLASSEGYLGNLVTMWKLLDSQLFTNLFIVIFLMMVLLLAVVFVKKQRVWDTAMLTKLGAVMTACAGYFLVVTKIAPYQIDRYIMPIYPLVYLLIIGLMYRLIKAIIPQKTAIILCILGFGGLSAVHMVHSNIPHTYSEDVIITPRLELAEEYKDCYVLYIGEREEDIPKYYDVLQVLSKYKGFYYIDDLSKEKQISNDMERLQDEEQLIIYVNHNAQIMDLENTHFLQRDEEWDVYLMSKE